MDLPFLSSALECCHLISVNLENEDQKKCVSVCGDSFLKGFLRRQTPLGRRVKVRGGGQRLPFKLRCSGSSSIRKCSKLEMNCLVFPQPDDLHVICVMHRYQKLFIRRMYVRRCSTSLERPLDSTLHLQLPRLIAFTTVKASGLQQNCCSKSFQIILKQCRLHLIYFTR